MPSKKEFAIRAKWMPYEVDMECADSESDELLARLIALTQHKTTLLMRGDGSQCYTTLVPCFNQITAASRFGYVTYRVRFGNGVRHLLGLHLTTRELIEAAERFASTHTEPTTHQI
jgi:hypothetical protein